MLLNLRRYVVDEAGTYSAQPNFDLSGWKDYVRSSHVTIIAPHHPHFSQVPANIPLQDNGSDCGVYTCKFAEYLGQRLDLDFSAQDMPYFRRRMLVDLLAASAD